MVKQKINEMKNENNFENKNMTWDFLKCQIRTLTIDYSISKSKRNQEKEKLLLETLQTLEKECEQDETKLYDYMKAKQEWEQLENVKAEGVLFRSKMKWVEMGEKNTKFFLNLEKKNFNQKYIRQLIVQNSTEVTKPDQILEEQRKYYENLYSSKLYDVSDNSLEFFNSKTQKTLSSLEKELCDTPLTLQEIGQALKQLQNDKTPGMDGFTTNFYKFFWLDLKDILFQSFCYSFHNGSLTNDQRRGVLNLIPKANKDLRFLRNWRPVSILNTDYKILTKALAIRLQEVLPNLIHTDQVGYLKGRHISENIRIIEDMLTYTNLKRLPGFLILIDFEKAFDSIEWHFLLKSLKSFNFGQNFIRWIKILYTNIESYISNNGYFSKSFKLSRGIRQGCPISALLFIIVAEIMALKIREDKNIMGIKVEQQELKLCQLADDTTIFVKDLKSTVELVRLLEKFHQCSGLKLNMEKTEAIPIGPNRLASITLPYSIRKIKINNSSFKTLGVWFSHDQNEACKLNFEDKLNKMKTILSIWKTRNLSWKGRILILKSLVTPQIHYLLSCCYCPSKYLTMIDKSLFNFLWGDKPAKIKRSTILATYKMGGLKMPDIFAINQTCKLKWLKKLISTDHGGKGQTLAWYLFNLEKIKLQTKLPTIFREKCLTLFHKQVFDSWHKYYVKPPDSAEDIYNEHIFDNQYICANGKPLQAKLFKIPGTESKNLVIADILSQNGIFIDINYFNLKFNAEVDVMNFNRLKSAIPISWKEKIKYQSKPNIPRHLNLKVKVKGRNVDFLKINNKALYWTVLNEHLEEPSAIDKWVEAYPFLNNITWYKVFYIHNVLYLMCI